MRQIKESDWKILRKIHTDAVERFCERILLEIEQIQSDSTKSFHQRYLEVFAFLRRRDKEIALTFDNPRRSTALQQLTAMKVRDLLTEEEFSRFSQETQDVVALLIEI
jgi:inhibitor of KinA sporulation pathway (predicted exonuclease)